MSARYRFTIEIYRYRHSLRTYLARDAHDAITVEVEDPRTEDDARTSPEIWKTAAQQKDERRQDNGDKKRLARQHPSNLLCLLTHERDRRRTARRLIDSALSFTILSDRTFYVPGVRHMMRTCILNTQGSLEEHILQWLMKQNLQLPVIL